MVSDRIKSPHNQLRDNGCQTSSLSLQGPLRSRILVASGYIHQQSRGDKILVPLEGNRIFVLAGTITQAVHLCQIHTRHDECDSRQHLQSRPDTSHGVVIPQGHCQPHISTMGASQSRSLCHEVQHQVGNLHVSNPEQQSSQHRRSGNELRKSHPSPPKV